jgi:hypothetical protein
MSARDSGSHLVIEISAELFSDLFRKYFLNTEAGMGSACAIWPSTSAVIQLRNNADGQASWGAAKADGTVFESILTLKQMVDEAIRIAATDRANLLGVPAPDSLHGRIELLVEDALPLRRSPSGALLPGHVSLSEVVFGTPDIVIRDFDFRIVRDVEDRVGLAIGVFFAPASRPDTSLLAGESAGQFAAFSANFLGQHDLGVALSTELIDRVIVQRPDVQAMLEEEMRKADYIPEGPRVTLSMQEAPRNQHVMRLSGRGEVPTEDCGRVDLDWWVDVTPSIRDGFLNARVEYDYDTDFWDGVQVVLCIAGNVALGAFLGFMVGGYIGAVVGGVLNFPSFGGPDTPGSNDTSLTSCGDQCFEIQVRNPASPDGRLTFDLGDGQVISGRWIDVAEWGISIWAGMTRSFRTSSLEIRDIRRQISVTAASACGGGALEYEPASFLLYNPHQPYESEFDWPQVCAIELTPDLHPHAEIFLMPQDAAPDGPFRVHGIHQQRVEVRLKPNAQPQGEVSGATVVRTNTPPTTRTVPITIVAVGDGAIDVEPLVLEFEQRDQEVLDARNIRRRRMCEEPAPPRGQLQSVGGSFRIRNVGNYTLHVCDLELNDPAQVFQLPVHRRFSLAPGGERWVHVVLNRNANVNQQYTATLTVHSTDPANPQVEVTVRGTALTPPRGVNVGGDIVVVDNLFDSACLELRPRPGDAPPIVDLERWKELFTDPAPVDPATIFVFEVGLRETLGRLELIVGEGDRAIVARSGEHAGAVVTLLDSQMKKARIEGIRGGEATHLRATSYAIGRVSDYKSGTRVNDLWSSGDIAALATGDGLQFVSLADPRKPKVVSTIRDARLNRLEGTAAALYGISPEGLEAFALTPEPGRRSRLELAGARDVAAVEGIAYVAGMEGVVVIGFEKDGTPAVLHRINGGALPIRIMASPSTLYVLAEEKLTAFSLERPWLPERVGTTAVRGVKTISHWGPHVSVRSEDGTRVFELTSKGALAEIGSHPGGHWADGFRADRHHRHLFSMHEDGRGFDMWRANRRIARAKPQR